MALDPIRLLHHVQQLQQAVLRCEVSGSSANQRTSATSLLKFELEDGTTKPLLSEEMGHDEGSASENEARGRGRPRICWTGGIRAKILSPINGSKSSPGSK